ncbi:uncharacterized protein CMU_027830 [Cryptosporidium muris RN66]|uniref:Uncharacterized protein n=1 Tax=Cryptosporidium muris (strain RN66) TaxID=441375 RepID=B6ABM1_CRYMR|nr:uncharacterized protein CMU_027830 [Cryptosporidium muris RN66]EEA05773.1 hypothetical protein, conserved [Cryptosporidium muris RN66]|eukprot:XP_002140122.1 hypothetical protein [Cryptosporidium muris RN66]
MARNISRQFKFDNKEKMSIAKFLRYLEVTNYFEGLHKSCEEIQKLENESEQIQKSKSIIIKSYKVDSPDIKLRELINKNITVDNIFLQRNWCYRLINEKPQEFTLKQGDFNRRYDKEDQDYLNHENDTSNLHYDNTADKSSQIIHFEPHKGFPIVNYEYFDINDITKYNPEPLSIQIKSHNTKRKYFYDVQNKNIETQDNQDEKYDTELENLNEIILSYEDQLSKNEKFEPYVLKSNQQQSDEYSNINKNKELDIFQDLLSRSDYCRFDCIQNMKDYFYFSDYRTENKDCNLNKSVLYNEKPYFKREIFRKKKTDALLPGYDNSSEEDIDQNYKNNQEESKVVNNNIIYIKETVENEEETQAKNTIKYFYDHPLELGLYIKKIDNLINKRKYAYEEEKYQRLHSEYTLKHKIKEYIYLHNMMYENYSKIELLQKELSYRSQFLINYKEELSNKIDGLLELKQILINSFGMLCHWCVCEPKYLDRKCTQKWGQISSALIPGGRSAHALLLCKRICHFDNRLGQLYASMYKKNLTLGNKILKQKKINTS